ncbi:MAG: glycosyltransferase [Bacteroidetes bacterium]|nr:glycosyltransferase [Bacteroidota bacterium]
MPKVLRITNRFNLGGITYNVSYLSRYLAPEFETMLIGGPNETSEESSLFIPESLGLHPVIIPQMRRSVNPFNDLAAYKKIKKIIREFKPDIVHTHASKAGALGRMAAFHCKVPVIVHTFHGHIFHSYFGKIKTGVIRSSEKYLARRTDAIIAISEKQKKELAIDHGICGEEKITVIPLGFDLGRFRIDMEQKRKNFRKEFEVADDEIAIVIIGRLVPVKNHFLFLRALKNVSEQTKKKIRAFIVGDGEERFALEIAAREIGFDFATEKIRVKKLLTFTSWIKDVDRVLAGSDIVCLTSMNEGTPVSLIEAQAACKPVVSTRVGGVENIVDPGNTALLCEPGDEKKFAENLLTLVENEAERNRMGKDGWDLVGKKFHYERLVSDMSNLYNRLLHSKG